MQGVDPALEGEKGRRPVLTLLREEKVAAEPTDELHFLGRRPVVWFYLLFRRGRGTANAVDRVDYRQPKAGCAVFHRTK